MKNDLYNSSIENFIPHRKPMLLLDKLIHVAENGIEASFCIDEQCIFLKEDNSLEAVALIEILAQCFAAGNGALHPARLGYLASMKSMKIYGKAMLGDTVIAKVSLVAKVGDIVVVEGKLFKNDTCILHGQYKIFVPSEY